jgi:hypothetical protein
MNDYKLPKDTYSAARYDELHFAVAHYGTAMHRNLWDMLVDAGLTKRQIFSHYMKVLRVTTAVNKDILYCVGTENFLIKPVDKQTKTK